MLCLPGRCGLHERLLPVWRIGSGRGRCTAMQPVIWQSLLPRPALQPTRQQPDLAPNGFVFNHSRHDACAQRRSPGPLHSIAAQSRWPPCGARYHSQGVLQSQYPAAAVSAGQAERLPCVQKVVAAGAFAREAYAQFFLPTRDVQVNKWGAPQRWAAAGLQRGPKSSGRRCSLNKRAAPSASACKQVWLGQLNVPLF